MKHVHSRLQLWLTAGWCGAAVMVCEIAGARLLMPVFGMGVEVWAVVIAVSLGALALGYGVGGCIADRRPGVASLALALLGCGVYAVLVAVFGRHAVNLCGNLPLALGAGVAALIVVGPPLCLLGGAPPMLVRLGMRDPQRAGGLVGSVMAVGTTGSVIGALVTGLVLVPRAGVSQTFFWTGIACLLVGAGTLVFRRRGEAVAALLGTVGVAALWLVAGNSTRPESHVLDQAESSYGDITLVEREGVRSLLVNGVSQTSVPLSTVGLVRGSLVAARDYVELIPYFRPDASTALVIGLGAGMHAHALSLHGMDVRCVEIDPVVVRMARRHFGYAGEVMAADGRAFLRSDTRRYDAIVLDAFFGSSMPEHLYTREAFELMKARLNTEGVLAVHLIARPDHPSVRAVARTLATVFPEWKAFRGGEEDEMQQIYLFASRQPLELFSRLELARYGFTAEAEFECDIEGGDVLTDDRTCLALMSRDIVADIRRNSRLTWRALP